MAKQRTDNDSSPVGQTVTDQAQPAVAEPRSGEESRLVDLDPRVLAAHPTNIRSDLGDLTDLAAGIREAGVIEPLVVTPIDSDDELDGDGGFRIVAGHRRCAAAILADQRTVPCLIRPDLAGLDGEQVAVMLQENLHRQDLTPVEEALGVAQLAAFPGWHPERIARRTGRTTAAVRHALAVAKVDEPLRPHVAVGGMTLEQAAEVAELSAGDDKAAKRLLEAAERGGQAPLGLPPGFDPPRRCKPYEDRVHRTTPESGLLEIPTTPHGVLVRRAEQDIENGAGRHG